MAKIRNSDPKTSGGGYARLLGDKDMAKIFTMAQSTVISNGTELEKIIGKNSNVIADLNEFIDRIDNDILLDGAYLCTKKVLKNSLYKLAGHEPDFIAFTVENHKKNCYVVELKDGDAFDTKKSLAEKEMLQLFVNHFAPKIPFKTKFYICAFNQSEKEKIVIGLKNVFAISEVMTGREFCDILNINYDNIVKLRAEDAEDNFKFIVEKMFEIKNFRRAFNKNYQAHIIENEFY